MRPAWKIWLDRRGRVSPLRIVTLLLLLFPLGLAIYTAKTSGLGARPLNDLIHRSGYWALMFLLMSLAVTPLRHVAHFGRLIDVRRMIGVGAFAYAFTHICLYIADQSFNLVKVASEIALRLYLTIGFTALVGLAILAITSTDAMTKRLGGVRWRRLHQIVYGIALLALIHFFQQTKADVSVPVFVAGVFGWLMTYRLIAWFSGDADLPVTWLLALAITAAALTFAGEAIGIGIAYRVSPLMVLSSAFDFDGDIRPGWLVLGAGLATVAVDLLSRLWRKPASPARHTAQAQA
jgi:sulfoxide reductase heme-binding subunit YedZ